MISRRYALAAISFLPVLSACASNSVTSSTETVPLPKNIEITLMPPASDVPPSIAAFAGKWNGVWGNTVPSNLYVEKISADGTAQVVYAWYDPWVVRGGATRYADGRISNGVLTIGNARVTFEYRMLKDGRLEGQRYVAGDTNFPIIMTKAKT